MTKAMTAEQFLADVANHKLTVRLDSGLYRHLLFRQPNNSNMWFEIVTWPGRLTISGDMGTWTFARLDDMFTFFRDSKLRINASYWAEKLQHGVHDGRDGARVFSEDLFKERLLEQLTEYYSLEGEELKKVTEALKDEVLCHDCKPDLLIAARDFKCGDFQFNICEFPTGKEYAFHFIWCLYAVVWAIQQYDATKTKSVEAQEVAWRTISGFSR